MIFNFLCWSINTLRLRQNGCHFADDTSKRIFLNENIIFSIKHSLKFTPEGPINNIPALVLIMAWHRPGHKPLSEPMMVRLLRHICITRPQWVKKANALTFSHVTRSMAWISDKRWRNLCTFFMTTSGWYSRWYIFLFHSIPWHLNVVGCYPRWAGD